MNRLFKLAFAVASVGMITRVLAFLYKIFLSRTVGAEALGSYQIALSVFFTITTVSSSGIPLALSRKIACSNNGAERDRLVSSALLIAEGVGIVICAFFLLFPGLRKLVVKGVAETVFITLLPAVLSSTAYAIVRARFWGMGKFASYSLTETVEGLLRTALGVTLITTNAFGSSLIGASVAFVVSDVASAVILCTLYFTSGGKLARPTEIKPIAVSALPMTSVRFLTELVGSLTAIILPQIMINSGIPSAEALSDYGRMSGMVMPTLLAPATVIGALSVVLVPELATDDANGNVQSVTRKLATALSFSTIVSCIAIGVFVPLGPRIGLAVFADERAGTLMSVTAPLILASNLCSVGSSALNSLGKERVTMKNHAIGAVLLLATITFLTPRLKIYAMPLGMALSNITTCALNLCVLNKIAPVVRPVAKTVLTCIICTVSACATASLASIIMPGKTLYALLILIAVCIATNVALMRLGNVMEIRYFFAGIKKRPASSRAR